MILHNSSQQPYRDKLGNRRLFKNSIDKLGCEIHGSGWTGPLSSCEPRIITANRTSLDGPDVDYAIDLILMFQTVTDMKWIEPDWNDSIPSMHNMPYMHISPDDWKFAHRKSTEIHNEQILIREQAHELLDRFSILALNGDIICYAQDRTTLRLKPIRPQDWNVGKEVLWSRYVSESIDLTSPAIPTYNGRYVISVDEKSLRDGCFLNYIDYEKRLAYIKRRLSEAALLYPAYAPHPEGLRELTSEVSSYLSINDKDAKTIISAIPGQAWGKRGRKKKTDKKPEKDFRIVP